MLSFALSSLRLFIDGAGMKKRIEGENQHADRDARSFSTILERRLSRRTFLRGTAALGALPFAGCATGPASEQPIKMGFAAVPISTDDTVRVPTGYRAQAFYRWGDPIGHASGAPQFRADASNTAAEQALQAGM